MKTHKDLDVWKASVELALLIYKEIKNFPKEEVYSLLSQIRRSAVSIPSNIAEGAARKSKKEFIQFRYIALGSLSELETQLIISERMNYLTKSASLTKIPDVQKLIHGLIRYLRGK